MTKFDVAVGDDFPLNESAEDRHGGHRHCRHHGRHHHGHHHGHGHRHHPLHMLAHLARLGVVAGLVALLIAGKIPAQAACGMIGLGVAVMLVLGFARMRRFRRAATDQT